MTQEEKLERLRKITQCLGPKIMENAVIYRGCVESGYLTSAVLEKLGIHHVKVYGKVKSLLEKKKLQHCWIETEDAIIETNPSQILGIDAGALAMKKETWHELTEAEEEEAFFPEEFGLTEAGRHFYNEAADQVIRCFRGKE